MTNAQMQRLEGIKIKASMKRFATWNLVGGILVLATVAVPPLLSASLPVVQVVSVILGLATIADAASGLVVASKFPEVPPIKRVATITLLAYIATGVIGAIAVAVLTTPVVLGLAFGAAFLLITLFFALIGKFNRDVTKNWDAKTSS